MKFLNQSVSLLLVFSMLLSSFPANAIEALPGAEEATVNFINSLPGAEESEPEPVPQNPPGTAPGVTCSVVDQKPNLLTGGVCCVGLELNALGKCDEPAFKDPALESCTSSSTCTNGTGCFPQSASDLFSGLSPSTADEEVLSSQKQELEAQLDETPMPKPVGATCIHSKDCVSYSCTAGICEDKKVCRFAGAGEFATASIQCGKDLIKKPNGMCDIDPNAKNPIYLGLLTESTVEPLGKCEFRLDEESRKKSIIAMQSLRAMEFFLATISVPADKECFDVMPLLKNDIGATYLTTRKNILTNFTDVLNQIEFDYKQLIDASTKYEYEKKEEPVDQTPQQITIHNDETISDKDLATRQTSGYDNLMMMYRRNLLFQSYEKSMLETVKASNVKVAGLSKGMGDWKDGDKTWNIGTKTVSAYNCEGSKYKKKKFLGSWKTKYYDQVKDRWSVHYEVSGAAEGNASIVKRDGVAEVLRLIGGKATKEEAITEFTKSKYYLVDPMLFSGMQYQGGAKALKSKSSFLGLFGGFKDLRKAYYIKGDSAGSYRKMHTDLKPKITEFYKSLKINKAQKGFVYEPELLTTEAKDCLDNPADPSKCEKFGPFLDGVHDESFAHFLAYSYSNKDSYEGFFSNATTYRRRLLAKMEVDMQNITKYYETIIKHRDTQNECIEKVINGLADSGILESDDDGLTEGGTYYDPTKGGKPAATSGSRTASSAIRRLSPISRSKFTFNLADSSLKKLGNAMMDNVATSGSSSSRGGVDASQSAFLASRKDALVKANAKASAAGIDVAAKEKAVLDSMKKLARGGSGSGASGGASGARGSSAFGFGDGTGKAAVSGDSASRNEVSGDKATGDGAGTITVGGAANAGAAGGLGDLSGIGGAGANGAGGDAAGSGTDATGLSDADKEKLMSEYERTKGDYQGTEEDGIFSKVSKAYVRNLDKVLNKKKKIEP